MVLLENAAPKFLLNALFSCCALNHLLASLLVANEKRISLRVLNVAVIAIWYISFAFVTQRYIMVFKPPNLFATLFN